MTDCRHRGILTDDFRRKEIRLRSDCNIQSVFDSLSQPQNIRNSVDGYKNYLKIYFQHYAEIRDYHRQKFFRKWRQTKYIARQRVLAEILSTILSTNAEFKKLGKLKTSPFNENNSRHQQPPANAAVPGEPPPDASPSNPQASVVIDSEDVVIEPTAAGTFDQPNDPNPTTQSAATTAGWPPIVVWGSAKFGGKKGYRPTPNKLLAKYIARYTLVIMMPEMRTSKQCLCTMDSVRKTDPLTGNGKTCSHRKRPIYVTVNITDTNGNVRQRKRRRMTCLVKHEGRWKRLSDLPANHPDYVAPSADQQDVYQCHHWNENAPLSTFCVERHRVCSHVCFTNFSHHASAMKIKIQLLALTRRRSFATIWSARNGYGRRISGLR